MVKTINFRLSYLLLWVMLLTQGNWLQAQVSCSAAAPPQVEAGQPFEYTITLNEQPSKISAVNFGNVRVLSGPNQGSYSQTTIDASGKVVSNVSYKFTYVLQADNVGSLVIQGTSFVVGGNTVKSNNVTVNIVPAGQGRAANGNQNRNQQAQGQGVPQLADNDAFVKCYASKSSAYQGEQVVLTYKLYVSGTFNGGYQVTNITPPSQNGLWSYQLGDPNAEAPRTTETLNGKRYTVFEIRKNAVFPQKTGEITVAPMTIDFVGRVVYQNQNSRSVWDQFFGGGQQAKDFNLNLKSNSIKLNVKALPTANQPENFDGVVGNYSIKSSLTRTELKANDATNLKITISGNGNLQHIEALNLVFPPDFDVSDPKITDNISSGGGVSGSRTFEYVIIPRNEGTFTIPAALLSFFDPSSSSYKTVTTDEYTLKIAKGDENGSQTTAIFSDKKDIKVLDRDIRYIKQKEHAFAKIGSPFFASLWFYILLFLPLLLFIIFVIIWRKQIEARRNIVMTKDKKATRVARKRLKNARLLLSQDNTDPFYVEISKVLWGYMSDKFHIPLSQLSMDTVADKLKEKNLNEESVNAFMNTLQRCEFARFAPGDPTQIKQEMYQLTLNFITNIEKN